MWTNPSPGEHPSATITPWTIPYRAACAALDVASFSEQLALAAAWLDHEAARGAPRPFRHVLVDEAQDLTPAHLQLLRALSRPGRTTCSWPRTPTSASTAGRSP